MRAFPATNDFFERGYHLELDEIGTMASVELSVTRARMGQALHKSPSPRIRTSLFYT